MSKAKRLICTKPFEWFEVTQLNGRGSVYLCCPSWLNRSVGNLQHQSVGEIWNGAAAQDIRRSILDGSFKYCDGARCPYLQTQSGPVKTIGEVEDKEIKSAIEKNLTMLPYGPKKIICTYDQSCNLSCPTCRTELIVEREHEREILGIQHKLQDQALEQADYLHITGSGDPFGSPYFRQWLQDMRREDMPRLEWIHLHSNGLLWTPGMWGRISASVRQLIKSTEISIDAATAETYAVNRRGGDLAKLLRNLEFISTLRQNGPLQHLKISMVVQANNFLEMPDFVRLGRRFHCDEVYFSQLVNWGTFSNEEFEQRAIHRPAHPRHLEFVELLQDEIFSDAIVDLGNLTETKAARRPLLTRMIRFARDRWTTVRAHS